MADFYDARGNTYFVALPDEIGKFADLPRTAAEAAKTHEHWAQRAVDRICSRPSVSEATGTGVVKRYRSDGLLIGPFLDEQAFGLLIVNTNGTLAERSGNGLAIFSQFLVENKQAYRSDAFFVRIYHNSSSFVEARIEAGLRDGKKGFWIDMGLPTYGLAAVGASPEHVGVSEFDGRLVSRIFDLEQIEASWTCSQFVNVGNPHCVTFLKSPDLLPSMKRLKSQKWMSSLSAIANGTESDGMRDLGPAFKNGVNLQWASVVGPDRIRARVFERGEGPTRSSGSSATAVACAARTLGLLDAKMVKVRMPGGVAPVRFDERNEGLERVMLFGVAQRGCSFPAPVEPRNDDPNSNLWSRQGRCWMNLSRVLLSPLCLSVREVQDIAQQLSKKHGPRNLDTLKLYRFVRTRVYLPIQRAAVSKGRVPMDHYPHYRVR